jgi:replication factor A1
VSLKLADIVDLIVTKSGKSKEEVSRLIEAKKKELDGYVTDEGAASLVARELDLDLFEKQPSPELRLSVRDLVAGMSGVTLNLRVLRIFPLRTFARKQGGEGKVASLVAADATGSIRVALWDSHTKPIEDHEIDEGDVIRIINGRVRTGLRDQLELHLGAGSRMMANPPDFDPKELPNAAVTSVTISSLKEGMGDVNLSATVTAKGRKTTFKRGEAEGTVASLSVGDKTGSTRLVLWDEQADWFEKLEAGDGIRVESGYVRLDRNNVAEVHVGRRGRVTKTAGGGKSSSLPSLNPLPLREFHPGNFGSVEVKVIANNGVSSFVRRDGSEGKRLVLMLADASGQARAVAWGGAADQLADVAKGSILRLESVACRAGLRQELEVHINDSTHIIRNPPGVKIGSASAELIQVDRIDQPLQWLADVAEGNTVTIRGTVVQVGHQRCVYDACPNCSRKVSLAGKGVTCPKCGSIPRSEPRLIAIVVLDDGTENMRARLIGTPAEKLLGITGAQAKKIIEEAGREDEPVVRVEDSLLGREVILSGRVRLNNFSNELELAVAAFQEPKATDVANRLIKELERKVQV